MKVIFTWVILIFSLGSMQAQSGFNITQKKDTYKLVVSFISKGSGIDGKSKEKIDEFIQKYPQKISYEICRMGREGETSYLFKLKELKKHEYKKFIQQLKEQVLNKEMVQVEENKLFDAPCRS